MFKKMMSEQKKQWELIKNTSKSRLVLIVILYVAFVVWVDYVGKIVDNYWLNKVCNRVPESKDDEDNSVKINLIIESDNDDKSPLSESPIVDRVDAFYAQFDDTDCTVQ